MTSRKTVLYAAVLAGALTLGLSGCNGGEKDPTPTASPTGSASSTVSPSPTSSGSGTVSGTPSPSVSVSVPAAARAHTEAGAIEFAKFYMAESDRAYVAVDSATLQALSGPSCEGCADAVKGVEDMKLAGTRQVRPSLEILNTNPLPGGSADHLEIQVQVRSSVVDIVDKSGSKVTATEAGQGVYRVVTRWSEGGWIATDMGFEQ